MEGFKLQILKPACILQPFIKNYVFWDVVLQDTKYRIFPTGNPDIVIHFGDKCKLANTKTDATHIYRSFVGGQLSESHNYFEVNGNVKCVGISFTPLGFYRLFSIPQIEIRDKIIDLKSILDKNCETLEEQMAKAKNVNELKTVVDSYFSRYLQINSFHQDLVSAVTQDIEEKKGCFSIGKIITKFNISERSLERKFKSILGLTPKEYGNIVRFNHVYKILQSGNYSVNWQDIIYQFGYYDQSHFIKDIKKFTNISPKMLLEKTGNSFYASRAYLQG